jgi:catechol 2,3-dioxygenase-like lactoylglutathione lyase family enzyme
MTGSITATVPVLASLDFVESAAFYTRYLGFHERLQAADYLILERDGLELHFWLCTERHVAQNTSCYVRTRDCQALYSEFSGRGLALAPPERTPWGMLELYVIDPHGNLLKFGEQTA